MVAFGLVLFRRQIWLGTSTRAPGSGLAVLFWDLDFGSVVAMKEPATVTNPAISGAASTAVFHPPPRGDLTPGVSRNDEGGKMRRWHGHALYSE